MEKGQLGVNDSDRIVRREIHAAECAYAREGVVCGEKEGSGDNQGIDGIHEITTSFKEGYNARRTKNDDNQDGERFPITGDAGEREGDLCVVEGIANQTSPTKNQCDSTVPNLPCGDQIPI